MSLLDQPRPTWDSWVPIPPALVVISSLIPRDINGYRLRLGSMAVPRCTANTLIAEDKPFAWVEIGAASLQSRWKDERSFAAGRQASESQWRPNVYTAAREPGRKQESRGREIHRAQAREASHCRSNFGGGQLRYAETAAGQVRKVSSVAACPPDGSDSQYTMSQTGTFNAGARHHATTLECIPNRDGSG